MKLLQESFNPHMYVSDRGACLGFHIQDPQHQCAKLFRVGAGGRGEEGGKEEGKKEEKREGKEKKG